MPEINIDIKGLDELNKKLGRAGSNRILYPPMVDAQSQVHRRFSSYTQSNPPKPAGSSYVRTFDLARSIHSKPIQQMASGLRATISSGLHYAKDVYSARDQKAIHRGRWPTDEQILQQEKPSIEARFNRAVERALR